MDRAKVAHHKRKRVKLQRELQIARKLWLERISALSSKTSLLEGDKVLYMFSPSELGSKDEAAALANEVISQHASFLAKINALQDASSQGARDLWLPPILIAPREISLHVTRSRCVTTLSLASARGLAEKLGVQGGLKAADYFVARPPVTDMRLVWRTDDGIERARFNIPPWAACFSAPAQKRPNVQIKRTHPKKVFARKRFLSESITVIARKEGTVLFSAKLARNSPQIDDLSNELTIDPTGNDDW